MDIRFNHQKLEPEIYKTWEQKQYFHTDVDSSKTPFVIVIPPPNVTGSLHIGHALNNTLQDILIRYKRMCGYEALYLPGTDHAGIATQFVVEQELAKEGKTRFDLGRDCFLDRVWQWKDQYGNEIINQLKRLGCSCDWSRTRFTMDEGYSRAIKYVFVSLFKKGLIYKGHYLVNWCPRCETALSDLEVIKKEHLGKLWYIKYPIKGTNDFVRLATTRPETILGDTAVAYHPSDSRYKHLKGKLVVLPAVNREIPIIEDSFVDPKFGTGMVKITPAHDFNDFECAQRHNLPKISVIDKKGMMTQEAGPFAGKDRFKCREEILKELSKLGLIEKIEDYQVVLGFCYRCGTILEPFLSMQWFVRMAPLVKPAIDAAIRGDVKFFPERWKEYYLDWLYNVKDWCISRQIWWGHRIPIWYCNCGTMMVSVDEPAHCIKCASPDLKQDEDVLDTWFSSALWPFATLGWPDETKDMERFYPSSVLVTGRDIICLWVARMIISGYEFCGDKPFSNVVINPMIQTFEGKRMSKSLGTGLDPIKLINDYGADALRFGLTIQTTQAQDIRFGNEKIELARNFVTKIWNSARFVIMNAKIQGPQIFPKDLKLEDQWIISRLQSTIRDYTVALENYRFGEACRIIYSFVWDEFCDYYIELSKRRISEENVQVILLNCVDEICRLLHPVIPFVTEAIWQNLKTGRTDHIIISQWPQYDKSIINPELEDSFQRSIQVIRAIRDVRNKMNIPRSVRLTAIIRADRYIDCFQESKEVIGFLADLESLTISKQATRPRPCSSFIADGFQVFVPLEGKIDFQAEKVRQTNKKKDILQKIQTLQKKLSNKEYKSRAPEDVIAQEEERLKSLNGQLEEIEELIAELS